jgi:hypothetical protein
MKKYKKQIILLFFLFFIPLLVLGEGTTLPNPLPFGTIPELINGVVNTIRTLALAIAPIVFMYAGLRYYYAQGDPEEAKKATHIMKWAIAGIVIILIANGITAVIKDAMEVKDAL